MTCYLGHCSLEHIFQANLFPARQNKNISSWEWASRLYWLLWPCLHSSVGPSEIAVCSLSAYHFLEHLFSMFAPNLRVFSYFQMQEHESLYKRNLFPNSLYCTFLHGPISKVFQGPSRHICMQHGFASPCHLYFQKCAN